MPTLDEVRKKIPELDGLDDQSAVDVLHSVYYPDLARDDVAAKLGVKPAPAPKPDTGQFVSGFKRSFADLPGLAAGVGGFVADAVGADETRDKLLTYAHEKNDQEAQDHATDAASLTDAWDGKSSWMDFLKNSAGYVAGQALQSLATGGVGSIGMRMLVKTGAAKIAEEAAAKAIAAGATEEAAKAVATKAATETLKKASIAGAAVGAGGHNFGMELGSIYPDAVDQAKAEGRDGLDAGDLTRVGLSAAAAAGVDTAAEGIMASKIMRGSGAAGGALRRAATEIPAGMAREAGTEAAQTAIEHYGAGQPIADDKGLKDIIDSAGIGAVGGGLGGGLAATHAHGQPAASPVVEQPEVAAPPVTAPAEQALAANAPLDAKGFQWTPPAAAAPGLAPTAQPGGMDFEADPRFAGAPTYSAGEAPPPQQIYGTQQAASMAIGEQGLVGTHSPVAIGPNAWEIRPDAAPDMKMIAPGIYEAPTPGDAIRAQLVPDNGPLSRATNLGLQAGAAHLDVDAAKIASQIPPAPAPLEPGHESALLDFANQRARELEAKAAGVKEKKTPGPDGKPVVTPEVPKQFLTPTEQAEQAFLAEHGGNAQALATHYSPAEQKAAEQAVAEQPAPASPPVEASTGEASNSAPAAAPQRPTVPGPNGDQRAVFSSEDVANAYLTDARRGRSTPLIASIKPVQRDDGTWMLATPDEIEAGKTYTDKLGPKGTPFAHKGQAMAVAKKIGGEAHKTEDGWVVRQEVPKQVQEWHPFAPESGTLGTPRAEMPQIAAEHRGAMTQFLTARGITHEQAEVDPTTLKPTQAEYSPAKVLKAREFEGGDRSILVSSDNHVLDGHHQWIAKLSTGEPVKVIRLDAPIAKLVAEVHEFPSSTVAAGATKTEPTNAAGPTERAIEGQAAPAEAQPTHAGSGDAGIARAKQPAGAGSTTVETDGLKGKRPPAAQRAADKRAERTTPLDHGELNIPGRTNGINADLDKYKAKQAAEAKVAKKQSALEQRSDKVLAKKLLAEHHDELLAWAVKDAAGLATAKELDHRMDQWAKWEPKKLIALVDTFLNRGAAAGKEEPLPFSRSKDTDEARALKALSENDELFQLPKSDQITVEGITADNDPDIKVKKATNIPGETRYNFTMPDGQTARMMVREANPYGASPYGFDLKDGEMGEIQTERPGDNPEDVPSTKGDVWIDVSLLKSGLDGRKIYNIAATYAHNTGRIFIGDPAGLSDDAMIRRPEQMLSSALKFGTTDHLAPHPRQITGDTKLGVPALKWVYGDDLGNIQRLIDLNLKVQNGTSDIRFDPATGNFLDSDGNVLTRSDIDSLAKGAGLGRASRAGGATIARAAVLRSLLREEGSGGKGAVGGRVDLLAKLAHLSSDGGSAARGLFYSRAQGNVDPASAARSREVETFASQIASHWANAPKIVVVGSLADPLIPESVRDEDTKQRSQGAAGDPEGFYLNGTVYLVSTQLPGDRDVLRVLMHESLGHFGLRSVFGKELATILDRMAVLQQGKVMTKAREYGLDMDKLSDRRAAAEEVLAEMAQTSPELGWVKRAVAAIRTWLRDNVSGFDKMKFSDDEIVRNFIEPARGWVKQGDNADGGDSTIAFARGADGKPIYTHEVVDPKTKKVMGEYQTVQAARAGRDRFDNKYGSYHYRVREKADPTRPMFSRSVGATLAQSRDWRDTALPAGYKVGDLMNDAGKLSVWHKSVGTMFNLAEKSEPFRRVYDSVQTFLNDVSYYASEAADKAPRILPRLSSIKDMGKTALSAEDTRAISAPIFEGTLSWGRDAQGKPTKSADLVKAAESKSTDDKAHDMLKRGLIDPGVLKMWQGRQQGEYQQMIDQRYESKALQPGIVWTPAELAAQFKLNPQQVSLYQEFRKATDESLNHLAISDMLRFGGKDVAEVRDKVTAMKDASKAAEVLRDHLFGMAAENPDRADVLNDTANKMIDKGDRAKDLIDRGYAPLSRFGQYTLDVVNADGERAYFGLFESSAERSKMARQMAQSFPDATIRQGTTSQEEYKMFAGVSPETLALFGDMLGLEEQGGDESSKVFQQYIKLAKNSRSAMKRLIERKGIAGFSEDAGRVLAGFVYSNARQTASNLHMGEIGDATQAIPQGQGQLKDAAVKLVDYVKNPQEEAQGLRGLLFAQYLGGSVASAMVNATQPLAVTFPYLSQFVGVGGAAKQMAAAVRDAVKATTGDTTLDAALKKAEEDGIVSPQEVHSLQAQAAGRAQLKGGDGTTLGDAAAKASNVAAKLQLLWGHVFSIPEQFNRRVTFIAAYRTAVAKSIANPAKFAAKAVAETQFTYNKGNKPQWARGAFGATLFTFKQYTVSYLELLHRMYNAGPEGKKAALLAVAVLFLMSGTDGLPGADDLDDLIDGFMQRLGYNWNTKMEKRRFFASILGEGAAQFLAKGVTGLPGAPIDVSGRIGMGNIIPGTGLFTKKADHTSDLLEMAGPAGDLAKRGFGAIGSLADGDVKAAATGILPTAASNWAKAYDMATTGAYHDQRGYKVLDTSGYDALAKAVGFQPQDVSKVQEAGAEAARYKGLQTLRTQEITAKWANGLATGDQAQVQEAKDERDAWNAKNPDTHMKINMPSVLKRVQEMRKSKEQRIEDSTPKAVRAKVRADLREQVG